MALPKEIKKVLDNMSAPALVSWLTYRHGEWYPIWKEVSKEEFDKHVGTPEDPKDLFEHMLTCEDIYRIVPIYKETGLSAMLNSEPIGYRYEKQVGKEFVILLGSDMMEYINKRKDLKEFRQLYDEVTKSQWISVEDELPMEFEPVLAAFGRHFARVCFHCGDTWYLDNPPVAEPMSGITHWMPLPQPPKKGGEE